MSPTSSFLARVGRSGAVGLVLMAVGGVSVAAGLARTTTSTPDGKVFVCKYVGTPGDDEHLQSGNNPTSVSINTIKDYQGPGSFFGDNQGRSYVLALDIGQPDPNVSECPAVLTASTTTSTVASTTTTTSAGGPTTTTTVDEPTTTTTTAVDEPTTTTTVDEPTTTTTTAVDEPTTTTTVHEPTTTTTVDEPTTTSTTPSAGNPTTTTSIDESAPTTVDGLQTTTTLSETKGGTVTIATTTPAAVGPHTTTSNAAIQSQTETLPLTGGASVPLVAIGSMLFAAGAAMTIVAMRRRRAA